LREQTETNTQQEISEAGQPENEVNGLIFCVADDENGDVDGNGSSARIAKQ
jgi:hypothetical protein